MKTDIEIAEEASLLPIAKVAARLNLTEDEFEQYGRFKAKLNPKSRGKQGKLILVTAINPTASGEGKTTVSIGLADAFSEIGANVCLALREPSLGPVFGIKGGATGGGYSQVAPMADINLHFTGDLHAITSANNLLASMIDNHLKWGNKLRFASVCFKRCLDLNDRALRQIVVGLGGEINGKPREDGFNITAASEVMAILCLALDLEDLKKRLGSIVVGLNDLNEPIFARDLKAQDAMAILLKDALKPNLVQTLIGTPAILHGGPFANIAHGCNSIIATKTALSLADYCITEAGFGADLGAEKFLDIKCRMANLNPSAVVLVATVRALKLLGGADKTTLKEENISCLKEGLANLGKHISNMQSVYGLPVVVAINKFITDTEREILEIKKYCTALSCDAITANIWAEGGKGGLELARAVKKVVDQNDNPNLSFSYDLESSIINKITSIAKRIYGASGVVIQPAAQKEIARLERLGFSSLPICIAKTQYSLSDNPLLLGCPKDFSLTVRDIQLRSGAGFLVAVCGDIMLMPGLPVVPNAESMTIDSSEKITGLF